MLGGMLGVTMRNAAVMAAILAFAGLFRANSDSHFWLVKPKHGGVQ